MSVFVGRADVLDEARHLAVAGFALCAEPNKLTGEHSAQFGLASAPIAPQIVQTMRGPNDGTGTSSP